MIFSQKRNKKSKERKGKISLAIILFAASAVFCSVFGILDYAIPNSISVCTENEPYSGLPFVSVSENDAIEYESCTSAFVTGRYTATARLWGKLPLKDIEVSVYDRAVLIPGGMAFGIKLYTKGVIVVGLSDVVMDDGSTQNPAKEAGIKIKDIIVSIDGKDVNSSKEVTAAFENCGGNSVSVKVMRGNDECSFSVLPVYSESDGKYKAGVWIRDSTAGIGTVTYIDPASGNFAGLGHGICDVDTGELMPLLTGSVTNVSITGIKRGEKGAPGELKGLFGTTNYGRLKLNTDTGVYGIMDTIPRSYQSEALPIALKHEVKEAEAEIICTLDEGGPQKYSVVIERICSTESNTKNFIIRVTDPALLDITGGIVQGMSGSPIIQDGHLIGAVTHVLINDPSRGYGIFIENMLDTAG